MNSAVLWLVAINLVATGAVLVLAYGAGARSGGKMLWHLGELRSGALYLLLCAAGVLAGASLFVFFRLSNAVCAPVKTLTEFAEQLSEGNFDARLDEVGGGTFGYINLHLNEAAATAAKAQKDEKAPEELQRSVEGMTATLRRMREAANDVSASAKEILSASEMIAAVATRQEHEIASPSPALEQRPAAAREPDKRPRAAAASIAATVAAAMQPAVVAPPVSIPGAQITGAIDLPMAPAASGGVPAPMLADDSAEMRLEILLLQNHVAQLETELASARELDKSGSVREDQ